MSVPPVPEEMDRMVPPKMIANLTFGGAVLVQEDSGMLCSPMGVVPCEKQGPIDRPPQLAVGGSGPPLAGPLADP
tara:strand:- start:250 stop:474 length:225 start_codon:yes stop_codon:yes gene_type:complete